jgi:hypothetical protein
MRNKEDLMNLENVVLLEWQFHFHFQLHNWRLPIHQLHQLLGLRHLQKEKDKMHLQHETHDAR